jgi:hypothetical protein
MGRWSSIDRLPDDQRAALNAALKTMTVEEIVAYMKELGAPLSASAVTRHRKKISEVAAQIKKSRMIAEAVGREIGDTPDDRLSALNIEMMHDQIMRLVTAGEEGEDGDGATLSTKEARELSDALYRLAAARKMDTERVLKVRKDTKEEDAKAAETVLAKTPGITKDTIAAVRKQILGIAG